MDLTQQADGGRAGRPTVGGPPVGGPAPELSVHAAGPGPVGIAGLTAGGAALLVFVSEHCPTSALALRRLGPLCPAWARRVDADRRLRRPAGRGDPHRAAAGLGG